MHAEVISIGDELTSGQRLDTNSQWLSERLGELGVRVLYHTTVADDLDANVRVFSTAAERADVIVATGGLGPTADDLTREALAAVTGRELVLNEGVLEFIRGLFARFGRTMPERNRVQALFPAGSRIIPNLHGTAPGIDVEILRPGRGPARIFALPGVPAEMFEMWAATVEPSIAEFVGARRVIRHRRVKCFGAGESHVEQMLPDLIRRGRDPSVGITVSGAVITLRITAQGETPDACFLSMEPTVATIKECLGELVYGEEEDELQNAVGRLLTSQKLSLTTVEWGSAGLIAEWLEAASACKPYFQGGLVVNNREMLSHVLGDSFQPADGQNVISSEFAQSMAEACRQRMQSDLALAVSDIPPLTAQSDASQRVYFALATPGGTVVRSASHVSHPSILKERTARQALNMLRLALLRENFGLE